jgi:Coenzyme PQQ synthesis protein D (PqqD)
MDPVDGKAFRINSTDVVHETVDGEVIAIDLARGSYYSLAGSAAHVWPMLVGGATVETVSAAFTSEQHGVDQIEQELRALLQRLADERLIMEAEEEGDAAPVAEPLKYEPPRFEKYSDMQDYFLLDPIHEVDATGWPNRPPG